MMAFALCPDGGLPRLWRFVEPGSLPAGVVTVLDAQQNILLIDKGLLDQLPELTRHQVLRTHARFTYVG